MVRSCYSCLSILRFMDILMVMSFWVQIFKWPYVLHFLGLTLMSKAARSDGKCMFYFMRNQEALFQSDCTIWHPYHLCMSVPVTPHLCQHLVGLVSLILVHLVSVYSGICLVLICISLVINDDHNDVDHSCSDWPFVYLLHRNVWIFCHLVLVIFYYLVLKVLYIYWI